MKLTNTEALIKTLVDDKRLESYILLVGYKDREWMINSEDVDKDTYFDAASLGKIFPTATLILKAIDTGMLSLGNTLENFFPNCPEEKRKITVKQLLTHTSGMLRKEFPDNVAERGRESIAEFILNVPLAYETGTKYAYCCTAYILLGFIIEKVYGMTLDKAFEEYLCKPLGLTRSKYIIAPDEPNAVNCNHDPKVLDIRRDDYNVSRMRGIPAGPGGNYCSAGDLQKFVKAVISKDERLYSKETFAIAEQNYTKNLPVLDKHRGIENHGLGYVYVDELCAQAQNLFPEGSIGHTGWSGQSFYLNRENELYAILLTNATRCAAKKYGIPDSDKVRSLRADIHKAIYEDLNELFEFKITHKGSASFSTERYPLLKEKTKTN